MKTTSKKISDTKVEVKATLDAADLKPLREQAVQQLAKNVNLQGFRKGKAPLSLIEKNLSPNDIANTTLDLAVRTTAGKALEEAKVMPLVLPRIEIEKYVPDETVEYKAEVEILPEIKLADYKKLKVKREQVPVSEADIQDVLDGIANAYAEKQVVQRAAKNGDEVIIDFTGKKDGEEFKGGKAKDYPLTLGSGSFIPGFEDQIIDHKSGDKFDINVTFPEDYGEKSLAGQPVIFEVLVKQVNEIIQPKMDDDFAAKCGPFKTMDEFKADIKKNLEAQNNHRVEEKYRDDLVRELVKKSKITAPEILIDDQLQAIKADATRNAEAHGMNFTEYLERISQTAEDWEKSARELATARVEASLALQILARDEKITVSDEEVEAKIAELRDAYKNSKEAIKNLKRSDVKQEIANRLVIDKTVEFLVDAIDKNQEK